MRRCLQRMVAARRQGESGYVLVVMAVSMVGLVLMVGFAVDLGSWYLRATKLQRAADMAALSGAGSLPDTAAAASVANDTFARNGFTNGNNITLTTTVDGSNVITKVKDDNVPTYFVKLLYPKVTIERTSRAQKLSTIPLGNPFNIIGYGNENGFQGKKSIKVTNPDGSPSPAQGFWLSVNGACTSKEQGDVRLAKHDGRAIVDGSGKVTGHNCSGPPSNPDYRAHGYFYAVDIPAGETGDVNIDVFDAQYSPIGGGSSAAQDGFDGPKGGEGFDTYFAVYDVSDPKNPKPMDKPVIFQNESSAGREVWYTLHTSKLTGPPRERNYVVQVSTGIANGHPNETGVNNFALMASAKTNGPSKHIMCDSRTAPTTCPKVYGRGAASIYAPALAVGSTTFFLAEIDPSFIGSRVSAYLWDPGEGAQKIELLYPDGTPASFTWSYTQGATKIPGNGGSPSTFIDVSGTKPRQPGYSGTGQYNASLITIDFDVPSDYASKIQAPGTDMWWKLRYTVGTTNVTERTTWGVSAGSASPARLAKAP